MKTKREEVKDKVVKSLKMSDMNEWKELFVCEEIIKVLAEKGFQSPTPIQRMTLAAALKGKMDIVGAAETGSGKTLAFGIPIIQGILEDRKYEAVNDNTEENDKEVDDEDEAEPLDDVNGFKASQETAVNVVDNV